MGRTGRRAKERRLWQPLRPVNRTGGPPIGVAALQHSVSIRWTARAKAC